MPLTLTICNVERLDNGSPSSLILDRRGAIIGRAATVDWCLPDPTMHVSSRHCEVQFTADGYVLVDVSTNGTFLRGSAARLAAPHTIASGDVFVIGQFEIAAALDEATASAMAQRNAAPPPPAWKGWDAGSGNAASPASASGWDAVPTASAISGSGPMSQNWAPPGTEPNPAAAPSPPSLGWGAPPAANGGAISPFVSTPPAPTSEKPASSGWGARPEAAPEPAASTWSAPLPPTSPASDWSTPIAGKAPSPPGGDIWGKIAASNVVDWARGGFGTPAPAPVPVVAQPVALPDAPKVEAGQPIAMPTTAARPAIAPPATATSPAMLLQLLEATGIDPAAIKRDEAGTLIQAGDLLRRLVAGLVVMLEARARAKSQMGAQGTSLEFDGNNPLKFARAPEQALAQLLNPPERGFMPAERAIEDAFRDLQAHQIATLRAMQGALRATLDRFSPTAIRARAATKGVLAKILPGARDAALWQAYEREFGGVAQGSDEAFMDIFAKEFRKAYDEAAGK